MNNYLFVLHNGVHYHNHCVFDTPLEISTELIDSVLLVVNESIGYCTIVNIIKLKG